MNPISVTLFSIIALSLAKNSKSSGSSNRKYRVGSLFSGILGLEIGLSKVFGNNIEIAFFCESKLIRSNSLNQNIRISYIHFS